MINEETKIVLLRVLPFLLIIIGIAIALLKKRIPPDGIYLKNPDSVKKFALWYILFLLFILVTEYTLYHFHLLKVTPWNNSLIPSILKITGIVILAPVAEELVFRGVLIYWLKRLKLNIHLAIFLQALMFMLLHSITYDNTFVTNLAIAQVFLDAVLFAYAMYSTKSIFTPILMHSSGNLVAVAEQFLIR